MYMILLRRKPMYICQNMFLLYVSTRIFHYCRLQDIAVLAQNDGHLSQKSFILGFTIVFFSITMYIALWESFPLENLILGNGTKPNFILD